MIKKIDHFNLKQICDSGQCFRWKQLSEDLFMVPAFGKILFIRKISDNTDSENNEFEFSCNEKEWECIWSSYFDTQRDYNSIEKRIVNGADVHLKESFANGSGIRILKQNLWEIIISFMISQNNNIKRISRSVELLCESSGIESEYDSKELNKFFNTSKTVNQILSEYSVSGFYKFPNADEINLSIFDDASFGFGYRAPYLKEMVQYTLDNPGWVDSLKNLSYEEAFNKLVSMKGIGPKVANCICLFGLNHVEAFPVDTHVKKLLEKYYSDGIDLSLFPNEAGIIQQYLFYYELVNK